MATNIIDWTGTLGGNWSNGDDWSSSIVPNATDIVLVTEGAGDIDVTDSEAASVLVVDDTSATIEVSGSLVVGTSLQLEDGTVLVSGFLSAASIVLSGGLLDLDGTIAGATITASSGLQIAGLDAVLQDVDYAGSLDVAVGEALTLDEANQALSWSLDTISNEGMLSLVGGGQLAGLSNFGVAEIVGDFAITTLDNAGGTIILDAGVTLSVGAGSSIGTVINNGGLLMIGGALDLDGSTVNTAQSPDLASVTVFEDGTLEDFTENLQISVVNMTVFTNNETITVQQGISSTFITSGTNTSFGVLDNCTVEGPLYGNVTVDGSLTVLAGTAGGVGTIYSGNILLDGTLDNAVLVGNTQIVGDTLTLGAHVLVEDEDGGGLSGLDVISNATIDVAAGTFVIASGAFTNNGVINLSQADILIDESQTTYSYYPPYGSFLYTDETITLTNGFSNLGILQVSAATTLALDAIADLADLGSIDGTDATLLVMGPQAGSGSPGQGFVVSAVPAATLDLGGATLDIGAGHNFNELDLKGVVENGFLAVGTGGYIANDGGSLENVTMVVPCFAAGTRLATLQGAVAVEDLRVGDLMQRRRKMDREPTGRLPSPFRPTENLAGPRAPWCFR